MMGEYLMRNENRGVSPFRGRFGIAMRLESFADQVQYLKYDLQNYVDVDFHCVVPPFSNSLIEEVVSPIINGFLFCKKEGAQIKQRDD
jgi:hypothetical protein